MKPFKLPPRRWFREGRSLTIRGRLALSFLTILGLFGLNLVVYSVSNLKRKATVEALRRAISSQILIADVIAKGLDLQRRQQPARSQLPGRAGFTRHRHLPLIGTPAERRHARSRQNTLSTKARMLPHPHNSETIRDLRRGMEHGRQTNA